MTLCAAPCDSGVVRILDSLAWNIDLAQLVSRLYELKFDSLSYENQEAVLDFFRARVEKMMDRSIPKDIVTAVLQSTHFVVRDLVETAALLAEKSSGRQLQVSSRKPVSSLQSS